MAFAGQARFFVVTYGDPDLNDQGVRSTTLFRFPSDGTTLIFDSQSPTGYVGVTPTQFITVAIDSGGSIPATEITSLTAPGQLLTSDGTANYVLPPAVADGKILTSDASQTGGLRWADPSAASGSFGPVNGLAARDTSLATDSSLQDGVLQATFLRTFATGSFAAIVPSVTGGGSIGSLSLRYTTIFVNVVDSTTVNATTVNTPAIQSIAGLALTSANPIVLTAQSTGASFGSAGFTSNSGFIVPNGQAYVFVDGSAALKWRIRIDGNNLVFEYHNGSSWGVKQTFFPS